MDNFEWSEGYNPEFRFGLYGVDFKTQERQIRASGKLYSEICHAGGLSEATVTTYTPELAPQMFRAG